MSYNGTLQGARICQTNFKMTINATCPPPNGLVAKHGLNVSSGIAVDVFCATPLRTCMFITEHMRILGRKNWRTSILFVDNATMK